MQQVWRYKAYPKTQVEKLAKRLKTEWLAYKEREKTNQTDFAAKLGITQSALNQFLSGTCPINNEMILMLCKELNVDPKSMVKGLSFFEPFFKTFASPRVINVRYKLDGCTAAQTSRAGVKLMAHVDVKGNIDVYAIEIKGDSYAPRYKNTEKLIIAAEEPAIGEEAYVVRKVGQQCASYMYHDHFECVKTSGCSACGDLTGPDDDLISHIHKVVGMSK